MRRILLTTALLACMSCAHRQTGGAFRVLAGNPDYLLRSPDSVVTPFSEVLSRYTGLGREWVELRPMMDLRIENAYYKQGFPKRGTNGFLGTQMARYEVRSNGRLRLISMESGLAEIPQDQRPVTKLMQASQLSFPLHRFSYAVVFRQQGQPRTSVLLGATRTADLERLTAALLADPDSVCRGKPVYCTVFPEACTVSLEIEIVANGSERSIIWGNTLANVTGRANRITLFRIYNGHLTPVEIDPNDPNARRLPLLPGDRVTWE